ncbi:hypothetical protein C7377_0550 [Balneicella halophila]|uniref:Endonuclease/exonuclease/phosphatase domain-containing protein n=1 Tax=Balneicella halophila TaxID=1537566 RepID=A0A7L4UR66_BALHA|nr:endonuclease/exonuclease/phosphatase family protein [Balneicella halophila]PVX52243.1 hypothetical protein C7377_0550 [Balneicella halophila]
MKRIFIVCFSVLLLSSTVAQNAEDRGDYRIVFYNVENLFDVENDSLTVDDDFTREGRMYWSFNKYKKKINRIAQVIMAVGGWEIPEIVGLCEVENRYVLEGLTRYTALARFHYDIIHYDSPDRRGIDVAMLYQKDKFTPLYTEALKVDLKDLDGGTTRDILYVKGETTTQDTLHIFVNHWPSKYGGALQTVPKRNKAALTLKAKTDSLLQNDPLAKIIIMGDLNTEADRTPIVKTLGARIKWENTDELGLYNLSARWNKISGYGSHKYHGVWGSLDHIIVSNGMFKGRGSLFVYENDAKVYCPAFLLEDDKEGGQKPFRTNIGMKYNDGFSDHLPVYLDLWRE